VAIPVARPAAIAATEAASSIVTSTPTAATSQAVRPPNLGDWAGRGRARASAPGATSVAALVPLPVHVGSIAPT
jgi:hypothetical protein